jgi:TolB-like protein/tetratricopeptide (TPR) repeat protein
MSTSDIPASGATSGPKGSTVSDRKLDSWGEIASYLGREVRTVQRWERTEGLPVHRHEHKKKSTVYAYAGELDAWIKNRQPKDDPAADDAFAREQELSGADSPVDDVVEPPVEPPPAPAPSSGSLKTAAVGKRVVAAIFTLGILSALSLGVYRWLWPAIVGSDKIRLVVLPFKNLSGDSRQDYISAGLTEEITTQLGRLDPQDLSVIAPTSAKLVSHEAITQIGEQLQVKYVLEGSVQSVASQIRIDVRLIKTSDASYAWTQSFTRELSDFLSVESDVADTVGKQILATLPATPAGETNTRLATVYTPEAAKSRDDYLRGRFTWGSRGDLPGSIQLFNEAIKEDPSFAEAYAGLAAATAILGQVPNDGLAPRDAKPKARDAAQHALRLDPRLADAHAVLGNVAMSYDWDLATAEKELRQSIALNPNDPTAHEWYGHLLIVEGRNAEALTEDRRALDLDPANPLYHTALAETYYFGRKYDAAIEEAGQVVKLHPDFPLAQFWLGSAYREKKMYPQAIETFQHARQASGDNPAMLMAYGHAQALAGNAAEARAALQKLQQQSATRFVPNLYPAAIHVGLGEKDEAFRLLNLAYEEKIDRLVYLNVDPIADPLRSDPRFAQLMAKVGFH